MSDQITIPFFYNTNQLKDAELQKRIEKCKGQEKDVYNFMLTHAGQGFNWSEVMNKIGIQMNECSLKRALSNLKKKTYLIKTDDRVMSASNELAHRYKFNEDLLA